MSVHRGGRGFGHLCRVIGTPTGLGGASGFATPTLSNFSALGTAPLILQGSTTDYVAGYRGQLQIATDSGFSTITQNWIFFIDGASWASNSVSTGLNTPSGTYFARWRIVRDNESGTTITGNDPLGNALSFGADVSAWSNTFTDTINVSVAALTTTTGTSKNSNVSVSGGPPALTFLGSDGVGAAQPVRATIAAQSAQVQLEITVVALKTASRFDAGFANITDNFNSGFPDPGVSNANGIAIRFFQSGQIQIVWNTTGTFFDFVNSAGSVAVADVFTIRLDTAAHTIDLWRTRSGSTTKLGAQMTGLPTLTAYYAFAAPLNNESGTFNFGATTFAKALDLGYAIYG